MELDVKVAIVTDGASGIEQGTVEAQVGRGMKEAVFDRNAHCACLDGAIRMQPRWGMI